MLSIITAVCALPFITQAQTEQNQNATSNGAGLLSGGNYTGYASAGQMATYMYANSSLIATQGIILNEISADVEFTFELSGNLTENPNGNTGQLVMKSAAANLQGTPLAFAWVYLVLASDSTVYDSTQTDANGYFLFENVPYRNFFFTVNSPVISSETPPVALSFEENQVFVKEIEIFGEVGTEGLSANVVLTPQLTNVSGDPEDLVLWYRDADADGFGNPNNSIKLNVGAQQSGYVENDLDCDDTRAWVNPSSSVDSAGTGVDYNCDGYFRWFTDNDGDGFGSEKTVLSVNPTPGAGESDNNLDCDDQNPDINPGIEDIPGSGEDLNCDGYIVWYVDADGDGFGSEETLESVNSTPETGESDNLLDCDDLNADAYPGAPEPPGSTVDLNCDGNIGCAEIEITSILVPEEAQVLGGTHEIYAFFQGDEPISEEWDWGDGNTTSGNVINNEIFGTYSYSEAGLYEITLTLENACGEITTKSYAYLILVDPCAGKIFGSGILLSKKTSGFFWPGSLSLSIYSFSADYNLNSQVPQLEGQFTFYSTTDYIWLRSQQPEWLMVAGDLAYLYGTAEVNQVPGYTFLVVLKDSRKNIVRNSDMIRIMIMNGDGEVVYDTQPGAGWMDEPTRHVTPWSNSIKPACQGLNKSAETSTTNLISPHKEEINIVAYPNPTSGQVKFIIDSHQAVKPEISVINLAGQEIIRREFGETRTVEIDLSGNPAGMYYFRTKIGEETYVNKIILKHQ